MICNIEKKTFHLRNDEGLLVGTYLEIRSIWGNVIYRVDYSGRELKMKNCTFVGEFDYLTLTRLEDEIFDCFRLEIHCKECGNAVYKLSAKLPWLINIKTDFHVKKK